MWSREDRRTLVLLLPLLVLAVAVSGGGAGWYFKIYRPKHEKAAEPEEDYGGELDGYDGGEPYGDEDDDGPPWDEEDDGGEYPDYDEFEDDGPPWDEEDETEEKEEIR